MYVSPLKKISCLALTLALLSSCATLRPTPIPPAEQTQRAHDDFKAIYANYVPVIRPLTLPDAIARALTYNFDAAAATSDVALQDKQADLSLYQLMPRIAADAGYNWRSNYNAAESVDVFTKQRSLDYSFSEEKAHGTADLQFSWNLLDAGVSYFQAKQQGYRAFASIERRRKVIDGLVKNVQEAYWRALAAKHMMPLFEPLLARAQKALEDSRRVGASSLQPEMQTLDYQQNLLQVISQIRHMRSDLNTAKIQLAALINIPDPSTLELADTDTTLVFQIATPQDIQKVEEASLSLRPELREAAYEEKIDRQDVYKEILKMMPGVSILAGLNTDSNRYLYNPQWGQVGVNASLNLLNIIQGPQAISAARTSVDIAHTRRLALSVAVLTQVNVSYQEYMAAMEDYKTADEINQIGQKIHQASLNAKQADTQSDAEDVRRELGTMVSELQRDQAVVHAHTALVNLYSAAGVDLVPPSADLHDLQKLTHNVEISIARWKQGSLPVPTTMLTPPAMPKTANKTADVPAPAVTAPAKTAEAAPASMVIAAATPPVLHTPVNTK